MVLVRFGAIRSILSIGSSHFRELTTTARWHGP
jgi:hypothetical protein